MAEAEGKSDAELDDVRRRFWPDYPAVDGSGITRMRLAQETDGSVVLSMRDAQGTERIQLAVTAAGTASVSAVEPDGTKRFLAGGAE